MFAKEIYLKRRRALRGRMKKGIIILPSGGESPINYPSNCYPFRADSSFLYFFGLNRPNYVGVIDIDQDYACLYGDDNSLDDIIWMGEQPSLKELGASVSIEASFPLRELSGYIKSAITKGRHIHFLPQYQCSSMLFIEQLTGINISAQKSYASKELIKAIVAMREIKEKEEIAEIDKACDIAVEMFQKAVELCYGGGSEQQVAAAIEAVALSRGRGLSFHSIVSQRSQVLHNHSHDKKLVEGNMLLIDAGAQSHEGYASDFTRTLPVGGVYSQVQRDIYDVVTAGFECANKIARAGVSWSEVHLAASLEIAKGLKSLGFMKGEMEDAVASGAHALFMPHGIGHMMGLDVHDMESYGEDFVGYDQSHERSTQFGLASLRMGKELKEGHVMTVEPGIYFIPALIDKWHKEMIGNKYINFDKCFEMKDFGGIRLEHDIVITKGGNRPLGHRSLPYKSTDIEKMFK